METLYFVLGMASVVVAVVTAVAVSAFVRVGKLNQHTKDNNQHTKDNYREIDRRIDRIENLVHELHNECMKEMDKRNDELTRFVDSRCDKLDSKISNNNK